MSNNRLLIIALLALGYAFFAQAEFDAVDYDESQFVSEEPVQYAVTSRSFQKGDYSIQPVSAFELKARVLAKSRYYFDRESDLSKYDLALGWGDMSKKSVIETLKITQNHRWYYYRYNGPPIIPQSRMASQSANMHLLASNPQIEDQIGKVKKGQIIKLTGYLVNVSAPDGYHWNSSLTRLDTGDGACEVIWVKSFEVLPSAF